MGPFGLYCLTVYAHALLLNVTTASPVEAMNNLLAFPGWIKMDVCEIIERRMDGEERLGVRHLLESSGDGPIVTKENVDQKIRQTHQFLTCNFVDQLRRYYGYVSGIGPQCERMECLEESLQCLEEYLQMIIHLVMPIRAALSCLRKLSPQTEYNMDMSEILDDIRNYYEGKTLEVSVLKDGTAMSLSAVKAEVVAINVEMSQIEQRLNALFNMFCWRDTVWDEEPVGISYASFRVKMLTSLYNPGKALMEIKKSAQRERDRFLQLFDGSFGFQYLPETTDVLLM